MWKNVEIITKIKLIGVRPCEQTKGITKLRMVTELVTADLDLIKLCSEEFNLDFKKRETWSCLMNSKTLEKLLRIAVGL
jgi:hypothetical protein